MRAPTIVALFAAYTITSSAGLLLLRVGLPKARQAFEQGMLVSTSSALAALGATAYITSFLLWMFVLANVPVARAYPVAVGLTLAFTALGAHFILGERVNLLNLLGIVTVFLGIVLITASATEPV